MKTRNFILLCALAAAGCTTRSSTAIVITKVLAPTATTTGAPPVTTCTLDPSAKELSYILYNPAENLGQVGVVVNNQLTSTAALNTVLRTDSTIFQPEQAVIDYEVLTPGAATPGRQVAAAGGAQVPGGTTGIVGVIMFPSATDVAGLAAGTFVRTTFRIEGKLADGSDTHTSEREYLFRICKSAGCAQNVCL